MLSSYNYSIEYKPGKYIPEADCLSRLLLNDTHREDVPIPGETVLFFEQLDTTHVTSSNVALMTKHDHTLSKELEMTKRGNFPLKRKDEELKPCVLQQTELSTPGDVLLWGIRVIITIEHLRRTFSTHGIPDTIVSDNPNCFTSTSTSSDSVFALIHARNSQTWFPATITVITGPLSYVV